MRSDELDKILDDALSTYSREEPRPGLDGRILIRVHAVREQRRFHWLRWAAAIAAFACFALAVTFWTTRDSTPKSRQPVRVIATTASPSPIAPQAVQTSVARRRPKHVHLPKREQFPTPTPLTVEERTLLAFVVRSPKQAEELFSSAKSRASEPLQIEEIQIEPLRDSGE
jgi:hypothetical protein